MGKCDNAFLLMMRIRDNYSGSRVRNFPSRIPGLKDPGSASKNLSILTQKMGSKL
jgi:hypothetical protein